MDILDYPHVVSKEKPIYKGYVYNKTFFNSDLWDYCTQKGRYSKIRITLEKNNNKYRMKVIGKDARLFTTYVCQQKKVGIECCEEVFKCILHDFICIYTKSTVDKEIIIGGEDSENYYVFIKL